MGPILYIKSGVSNNHHEGHEENEEKKLHDLHVLHGKKNNQRSKPLQVQKRSYIQFSLAFQGFNKWGIARKHFIN